MPPKKRKKSKGLSWDLKRVALYTLCGTLTVAVVLLCVTLWKAGPLLGALLGGGNAAVTNNGGSPTFQPTAAPPSTSQPSTSEPTESTPTLPEPTLEPVSPDHVHSFTLSHDIRATCNSPGRSFYICSCGAAEMREETPAQGHQFGAETTVAATCTQDGYTGNPCTRCGAVRITSTLKATGHQFGDWTVVREPAPNDQGERNRKCAACQWVETNAFALQLSTQENASGDDRIYEISANAETSKGETVEVYHFTVVAKNGAAVLSSSYQTGTGLVVHYTDGAGESGSVTVAPGASVTVGAASVEPPEPTDPTEPTTPTDPTEPTDPTNPTDPTEPTVPEEPSEPKDPVESGEQEPET